MQVDADLHATAGSLETRLEASGSMLRLTVNDVSAVASNLPAIRRSHVASIARTLDRADLSATLLDPAGPFLELGAGNRSYLGRLMFGTRLVRLRRPGVWLRLALRR